MAKEPGRGSGGRRKKNIQSRTLSCNLSLRLTLGVIADWIKTVISTRIGRVRRACSLYPYQRWPYDSDRTFSTLDSDANPELRRKEAVVVNRYPARNSAFVRPGSNTQSEEHVNGRLGLVEGSPPSLSFSPSPVKSISGRCAR